MTTSKASVLAIVLAQAVTTIAVLVTLRQAKENGETLEKVVPRVVEMWNMKERGITNRDALQNRPPRK